MLSLSAGELSSLHAVTACCVPCCRACSSAVRVANEHRPSVQLEVYALQHPARMSLRDLCHRDEFLSMSDITNIHKKVDSTTHRRADNDMETAVCSKRAGPRPILPVVSA